MKKLIAFTLLLVFSSAARAEYKSIDLTVFGMDCAPCAHAVRVSMKGIPGIDKVDVDLNTGLVSLRLTAGNSATMRQIEEAIEKNGFTHKQASVTVRGKVTGTADTPVLEVAGTSDHYLLNAEGITQDIHAWMGKTVEVQGVLPMASKGKVPVSLHFKSMQEVK